MGAILMTNESYYHGVDQAAIKQVFIDRGILNDVINVDGLVRVTRGGFRYVRATGHFVQLVTVQNISAGGIDCPVSLVLDNLSANATLIGAAGTTVEFYPQGSPYLNILAGTMPSGASVTVQLDFANPSRAAVTYSTRVLAGNGPR